MPALSLRAVQSTSGANRCEPGCQFQGGKQHGRQAMAPTHPLSGQGTPITRGGSGAPVRDSVTVPFRQPAQAQRISLLPCGNSSGGGLTDRELIRISPPGSRHLRGLSFTPAAWKQLATQGQAVYLFAPDPSAPSDAALRYIEAGEVTGVQTAYKCRVRNPWWRVPLVRVPDLLLT
jgi:hypothetical protein